MRPANHCEDNLLDVEVTSMCHHDPHEVAANVHAYLGLVNERRWCGVLDVAVPDLAVQGASMIAGPSSGLVLVQKSLGNELLPSQV